MAVAVRAGRAAVLAGSALAAAGDGAHRLEPAGAARAARAAARVRETVSVLLPVRDEAARVGPCVGALLAQSGVDDLEILVLDDGSTDGTADVVRAVGGDDPRVRVLDGGHARCRTAGSASRTRASSLADAATGRVLVFVDADVVLEPHAVAATVALLRSSGLDLVCPYPRQVAETSGRAARAAAAAVVVADLPAAAASPSARRASRWSPANGQLLAVDAAAYRRAGGHAGGARRRARRHRAAARGQAQRRAGGVVDGTHLATCRMYEGAGPLCEGYTKSLWSAFGPRRWRRR